MAIGCSYSYSENWFVENARWYVSHDMTYNEEIVEDYYREIYELRKNPEAEDDCLEMICTRVKDGQREGEETFIAFIRVDGERVYFKDAWNWDKWYLMYDFSITPTHHTVVWDVKTQGNSYKYPTPVELYCYEMFQTENPEIRIASVVDSDEYEWRYFTGDGSLRYMSGYWILGIGSTEGPIENCEYGLLGKSQKLLRFEVGDEIIYECDLIAGVSQNKKDDQSSVDHSSPKYSLDGRLLSPDADGLYIQNGRLHLNHSR